MSTATGYAKTGASFFFEFIPILSISLCCGWPFDSQSILCPPSDLFVLVAKVLPDALLVFRGTYNVEKGATNSEVCVIGDRAEYYIVRDAYGFFSFHCSADALGPAETGNDDESGGPGDRDPEREYSAGAA